MTLRADFLALDDRLAGLGVPPLTIWWRTGIGAWLDAYEAGQVLELWACVGRGASKSTALYKLALFFALFGEFAVPPGERHFAVILSRLKEEASKGVAIIAAWLRLLGVPHHPSGDVIELDDQPRGIRVVAASVAATSGWRAFFVGRDERSKWASEGAADLDAEEIDTSAAAMTATHAYAPIVSFGSAWGAFGSFYEAITGGATEHRHVLGPAPTWVAAPHITEESCRRKERDPRKFAREYRCEFQAAAFATFDMDAVDRAFDRSLDGMTAGQSALLVDPSSGGADAFTYALARWYWPPHSSRWVTYRTHVAGHPVDSFVNDERDNRIPNPAWEASLASPVLRVDNIGAFEGGFWGKLGGSEIVSRIVDHVCKPHRVTLGYGDQRERLMLASQFASLGVRYLPIDWTASNKPVAVERVRTWLRDGTISIEPNPKLRAELATFEEKILPSGQLSFAARRGGHDDRVALLITAALADAEGGIPSSPAHPRREIGPLPIA